MRGFQGVMVSAVAFRRQGTQPTTDGSPSALVLSRLYLLPYLSPLLFTPGLFLGLKWWVPYAFREIY